MKVVLEKDYIHNGQIYKAGEAVEVPQEMVESLGLASQPEEGTATGTDPNPAPEPTEGDEPPTEIEPEEDEEPPTKIYTTIEIEVY